MTESAAAKETWLPNLVGGVSIWKLASDLNQDRFFDGRLLVPETEGSDSLPVKVLWTIEGLVPLKEARASHAEAVGVATTEFLACVERVKKELSSEASGYKKFRDAFSIPGLDADGEENYFFDPATGKLCVINWGASPRSMAGKGELVFGYDRFEELLARARGAAGTTAVAAAAGAGAAMALDKPAGDAKKVDPPADAKEKKKRSIWFWLAIALGIIVAIILLGLLFHSCHDVDDHPDAGPSAGPSASASSGPRDAGPDAADAGKDGGADAGDAGADAGDAGGDAGADAGDAGAGDAGADAGDAGADAGDKDAGKDGGPIGVDNSGTPPQNGKVYVIQGDGGLPSPGGAVSPDGTPRPRPSRPVPFRSHYQPDATSWRISGGSDVVDQDFPPVMNNGAFEVYLKPGHTFSEITVEYKDKNGNWHTH